MPRFSFAGLRFRLILLVLMAVLPALGLTLYHGVEERRVEADRTKEDLLRLTRLAAGNQDALIEGARQLLIALSNLSQVRSADAVACNSLMSDLLEEYRVYPNLGVIEPDGDVFCSAVPRGGPVNLTDRAYFRRAIDTRDFAIGDYQIGRLTGKASVNFGYPVLSESGELEAVVFAALDLSWLNQLAAQAQLPEGAVLSFTDLNGTILARYPEPEKWVGKTLPEAPIVQAILNQHSEGTAEAAGLDGVVRLYAFTPLGAEPDASPYISIGIPVAVAFAKADQTLARNLALLGLVAVFAIIAAWEFGDVFILRRVNALVRATKRLAAGDLSARTGVRYGLGELSQLARAFDEMAEALEQRSTQLHQAEAKYRTLVEQLPAIVYIAGFGEAAEWVYVSPQIKSLLGFSPKEWTANPQLWFKQLHPEDRERVLAEEAYSRETGTPLISEYRVFACDGRLVWVHDEAILTQDEAGQPSFLQGVIVDITGRKRAEEALLESETRTRAILESALDCIISIDHEGKIIEFNPAAEKTFGYTRDEVIGKEMAELIIPPSLRQQHRRGLAHYLATGEGPVLGKRIEITALRADGSEFPVELAISPTHLQGRPAFTASVRDITERKHVEEELRKHREHLEELVEQRTGELRKVNEQLQREITERKQAEEALRSSEERFRQLAENIHEVFWVTSPERDRMLYVSPAYEDIWGLTCESLYQDPWSFVDIIHPGDRESVISAFEKQRQGQPTFSEYRIVRSDGSIGWIWSREFPIRNEFGEVYRIVGIGEDITERKQAEQELRKALEKEKELNELKSRFISMASHEFRTPLSTILSSADLLEHYRHKLTEEKNLDYLHRIQAAVKNMTQMLNDVLIIGKAEAGKLAFNPAPLDLVSFCRDLVEELQLSARTKHPIDFAVHGQCTKACMDEKLLRQILANLLSNAIKYSPQGGTVRFELHCEDGRAIFRIQDQGIGIPLEEQGRLFDTFHRATNVGNIPGTGLGLAIVKRSVDLHGGTITFTSKVGLGTTFTVSLPLSPPAQKRNTHEKDSRG